MPEERTDEEIAKMVQNGDKEAFGVLIERFSKRLLRYGHRFMGKKEDIEDLVQEIFIKSYINIQSFDTNRRFSPWIYRIAHNEFVNAMKKKARYPFMTLDFDSLLPHLRAKETADRDSEIREMRTAIDKGLDALPPKYREPVVLYFLEEMEYKEIADILRIPISTVGVRIQRAKKLLKEKINYER